MKYLKYLFLILLCLTPVLWFIGHDSAIINGSDTNFPLNPANWFTRRFFVWSSSLNAGNEFSSSTAGTFFHFIQFLPYKLGIPLQKVQLISLIFWFASIILFAYLFSGVILSQVLSRFIFTVLYTFNIYAYNSWENVKVANLSLLAATPLGLYILFSKRKLHEKILLSIPLGIYLSGAGINPAYFMVFYFVLAIPILIDLLLLNIKSFKVKLIDFLVILFTTIAVNLYWLLPTLNYIFTNIAPQESINSIGYVNWVYSLSKNTSLVNVMRLMGAWDWYAFDYNGAPLYIPYAPKYFYNIIFISFSFLILFLLICSLIFKKAKKNNLYLSFALMFIIGVFMSAGTHPPTGALFVFFLTHVPFFSLFRSPWYIFSLLVLLPIAGLISLFSDYLITHLKSQYQLFAKVAMSLFLVGYLFYSYPLIKGSIFRPDFEGGFYINFPEHIFQATDWFDENQLDHRLILYPDDQIERFSWGYSAVNSVINLFTDQEVVTSVLSDNLQGYDKIVDYYYKSLKRSELVAVNNLANTLDVGYQLDKKDSTTLSYQLPENLWQDKRFEFGPWSLYALPGITSQRVSLSNNFVAVYPYTKIPELVKFIEGDSVLVNYHDTVIDYTGEIKTARQAYIADNSQNPDNFKDLTYFEKNLVPKNTQEVVFSIELLNKGEFIPRLERYRLEEFGINPSADLVVTLDNQNVTFVHDITTDSYVSYKPVHLEKGQHEIKMFLGNYPLVETLDLTQEPNRIENKPEISHEDGRMCVLNYSQDGQDARIIYELGDLDPLRKYYISTKYHHIFGKQFAIFATQYSDKGLIKSDHAFFTEFMTPNLYGFYFDPVWIQSHFRLGFLIRGNKIVPITKFCIEQVNIYKLFDNDMVLIEAAKKEEKPNIDTILKIEKINHTLYRGTVKNAHDNVNIVFSESYSPEWKFKIVGESAVNKNHYLANSYANGWIVQNAPEEFEFEIYYQPQKYYKYGAYSALLFIAAAIGYYFYKYVQDK